MNQITCHHHDERTWFICIWFWWRVNLLGDERWEREKITPPYQGMLIARFCATWYVGNLMRFWVCENGHCHNVLPKETQGNNSYHITSKFPGGIILFSLLSALFRTLEELFTVAEVLTYINLCENLQDWLKNKWSSREKAVGKKTVSFISFCVFSELVHFL